MDNSAQEEFWNGAAGDVWVEAQDYMDRMLQPLSDAAVTKAAPTAAERVIDVGCGCGATTLDLARSGATIWGVDISEPMVAHARQRSANQPNITYSVTDAATAVYEPNHNLIFSRFGVMFFADPKAAFTNLRTALVPGGRLTFVCWQAPKENTWMSAGARAAAPFLPQTEAMDPRAPGPFAFADKDWIAEILTDAGFADINIESATPDLNVGKDVDEAMYLQGRIGPMARLLAELDEETQAKAKAAARAALEPFATSEGVLMRSAGWVVSAEAGQPS